MKPLATTDRPYWSSGSQNALESPDQSDRCVCMPEPCTPSIGLGMNVAWTPEAMATSRTIIRSAMTLSAIVRPSA